MSTLLAAVGLFTSCSTPDLYEPLRGRIDADLELEVFARAGLFLADPFGGEPMTWQVDPVNAGRLTTSFSPALEMPLVEVAPVALASGPPSDIVFDWPEKTPSNPRERQLLALVWWDGDEDGLLDVRSEGEGESVRAVGQTAGVTEFFLTELTWVPELDHVDGRAESAEGGSFRLDSSRGTGWRGRLTERTEPPLLE